MPTTSLKIQIPENLNEWHLVGDRYLIQLGDLNDTITPSGFLVPDVGELKRGYAAGEVVLVGNGHKIEREETVTMHFKVGDIIIFERLSGKEIMLGGRRHRLVAQVDCLAKIAP
jgi:co-chaperonin GroES (HSP10)